MFDGSNVDREIEFFIFDIYIAILKIKEVVKEFDDVEGLLYDFRSWDSVIREFEIVGEASKYLLKANLLEAQYRRVVDFRNSITHGYFGIDQNIVWGIIQQKLDDIENIILNLIQNIELNLKNELIDSFIKDNHYLDFVVENLENLKN